MTQGGKGKKNRRQKEKEKVLSPPVKRPDDPSRIGKRGEKRILRTRVT